MRQKHKKKMILNLLKSEKFGNFQTDLEASIDEQNEEFENFGKDRRHSIILRNMFYPVKFS